MNMTDSVNDPDYSGLSVDASELFIKNLASQVNQHDVQFMVQSQIEMLLRLEKTNEMLYNYNSLSSSRIETVGKDFRKHTLILNEMKKDLDVVFRKIRMLKARLSTQYSNSFAACSKVDDCLEEEDDDGSSKELKNSDAVIDNTKVPDCTDGQPCDNSKTEFESEVIDNVTHNEVYSPSDDD